MGRQQQPARRVMRVLAELRERERERRPTFAPRSCCAGFNVVHRFWGQRGESGGVVEGSTWPGRWRHGVVKKGDLVDESDTKQYRTVEYDYNLYGFRLYAV